MLVDFGKSEVLSIFHGGQKLQKYKNERMLLIWSETLDLFANSAYRMPLFGTENVSL